MRTDTHSDVVGSPLSEDKQEHSGCRTHCNLREKLSTVSAESRIPTVADEDMKHTYFVCNAILFLDRT